jgi:hypothetical protein
MEILTAYVRQNAPLPSQAGQERTEDTTDEQRAMEGSRDIQAIMTILRRRKRYYRHGESEPLELRETNLPGANLNEANLSGALLAGAELSGADLSEAKRLTQEQLEQAQGDEDTQLPSHLTTPTHWGEKTDEQPEED